MGEEIEGPVSVIRSSDQASTVVWNHQQAEHPDLVGVRGVQRA
ncbi:MAG: hypothetical protein ACR2MB_04575 [Acidimicrobiales bacterium]